MGFSASPAQLITLNGQTALEEAADREQLRQLRAAAADLVGVSVDKIDLLLADQAVAEELLAKLTPAAE